MSLHEAAKFIFIYGETLQLLGDFVAHIPYRGSAPGPPH